MRATAVLPANRRRWKKLPSSLFAACVTLVLLWGWSERGEYWYSADHGLGYAFGIVGLGLMGLLLLYPLRKHWKPISSLFPVRYWFRMHMVFGILGPVLVLFHANFRQGSINSSIALYSMLLVSGSGLVGRYVYTQIHRGLYGESIRYKDLVKEFEGARPAVVANKRVKSIRASLDSNATSFLRLLICIRVVRRWMAAESNPRNLEALRILSRMARLRIFSKLFSWWHLFHLPIFFMMLIAAAIHVVVVTMY